MFDIKKGRTCGECTACCKTHGVLSIDKEPNVWCPHCEISVGCRKYNDRPEECRVFLCAWLIGEGEEHERPDKNKCVLGVDDIKGLGDTFTIHEMRTGAFEASPVSQTWMRKGMMMRLPIFIRKDHGQDQLLIPPTMELDPETKQGLLEEKISVRRYHLLK